MFFHESKIQTDARTARTVRRWTMTRTRTTNVGVSWRQRWWSIARRSTDVATPRRVRGLSRGSCRHRRSGLPPTPTPLFHPLQTRSQPSTHYGTTRKLTDPPQTTLISCSHYKTRDHIPATLAPTNVRGLIVATNIPTPPRIPRNPRDRDTMIRNEMSNKSE